MLKNKVRKILKDLKIDYISIVEGEMDPVNEDAKALFVKSRKKEEDKEMEIKKEDGKFAAFLKTMGWKKIEEPKPEETPIEEPEMQKADTPEYVTKSDFNTAIGEIKTLITGANAEIVKANKAETMDIVSKLVAAHNEDIGTLQADVAKSKRAASPVEVTPDLLDIIKASGEANLKKGSPSKNAAVNGTVVDELIDELVEKGEFKDRIMPEKESEFDRCIKRLCNTGLEEGGTV